MTGCGTERYADWFFDLDGTLVDSAPDILRLLGGVLREEGLAVPELDKGRIGPLLEDIIRGICPDLAPADLERIVRIYRARYRACPFDESPAFPGIPPLFERRPVVCGYQQAGGRNPPSARRPGSSAVSGRVRVQRLAAGAAALQGRDAGPAHGTPRRGAGDGDYGRGLGARHAGRAGGGHGHGCGLVRVWAARGAARNRA